MKDIARPILATSIAALLTLAACSTPPTHDFGGRWRPVNQLQKRAVEVPLSLPYTYYAAPVDATLKTMVTRWAKDTGAQLDYRLRSDFTLSKATSSIRTTELRDATSQLTSIYSSQGVEVTVDGRRILVKEASTSASQGHNESLEPHRP